MGWKASCVLLVLPPQWNLTFSSCQRGFPGRCYQNTLISSKQKHWVSLQSKWLFKPLGYGELLKSPMLNGSSGRHCQKGQMEQVCDEIAYFAVSFGFVYFHRRLGHALYCSSLFIINFHSSYHQGSLIFQFPKLETAHKLHIPRTLVISRLKWLLLLQLLPSRITRPAVRTKK